MVVRSPLLYLPTRRGKVDQKNAPRLSITWLLYFTFYPLLAKTTTVLGSPIIPALSNIMARAVIHFTFFAVVTTSVRDTVTEETKCLFSQGQFEAIPKQLCLLSRRLSNLMVASCSFLRSSTLIASRIQSVWVAKQTTWDWDRGRDRLNFALPKKR